MQKPINEATLQIAIAHAQVEYYRELRTGTMPKIKEVPEGIQHLERFSQLVAESYQYFNDMCGIENILDLKCYKSEE